MIYPINYVNLFVSQIVCDCQAAMEQYKILGRIGEGAHGIVSKAKHIEVWVVLFTHSEDTEAL